MHKPDHNPARLTRYLEDEAATLAFGTELAKGIAPGLVIYLSGDLGTGKTTLARGLLRGLGYVGKVKSPSFTLVELYKLSRLYLYHFDFYRFKDPKELDEAGFRDYFGTNAVCLVEWPEKAAGELPPADLIIAMRVADGGRMAEVFANTEAGRGCLERLTR